MQYIFLLPLFISLVYVSLNKRDKAFLNVYLPCLILLPTFYNVRLPHLPPISPSSAALIPIGVSLLFQPKVRWRFRRLDLWVVLFMVSIGISETLREYNPKDGMVLWMEDFIEMFLAYVVGRQIIEPELRMETIKRITFMMVAQMPLALYEYRFGVNPFFRYGPLLGMYNIGWIVQLRGGTARISTTFAHPILAGILIVVFFTLNYYLYQVYKLHKTKLGPRMSWLQKYRIPMLWLPVMLYMTGSRMPMACGVMCFLLLQIPSFKTIKKGVVVILLVICVGGGITYAGFQAYTNVKEGQDVNDEAKSSAIYRKDLLVNYAPILKSGGWFGWGVESFPRVQGQSSIDNDYLILELAQGKLGKYSFLLLAFESVFTLIMYVRRFRSRESLYLVFSLMGALIGIFVALSTVALFEQVIQVLFLLLGWSQSVQDTQVAGATAMSMAPEPKFRFRRVIA